jgi:hypothetical protein
VGQEGDLPARERGARGKQRERVARLEDPDSPCTEALVAVGCVEEHIAEAELLEPGEDCVGAGAGAAVPVRVAPPREIAVVAAAAVPHLHKPRPHVLGGGADRLGAGHHVVRLGDELVAGQWATGLVLGRAGASPPRPDDAVDGLGRVLRGHEQPIGFARPQAFS